MLELSGKTAFITGGASGIGFGMAEAFVDAGMTVVIADIEDGALAKAKASLARKSNAVHAIRLDVTDRDAYARAADEVTTLFGNLHVLCNNAGVAARGLIQNASYADWDWTLGVNIGGVVNGIRTFLPRMIAHGEAGHVVNTSSMAGLGAAPGNTVYSTSKFAVVGLSEGLRKELAPQNIGVTVLCPAAVKTNFNRNARNRPAHLAETGTELTEEWYDLVEKSFEGGTEPRELGDMVVDAIRKNAPYVIPHSEFREGFRAKIEEMLSFWNDAPPDPKRIAGGKYRQQAFGQITTVKKGG
jgi:NAD(P)-dependent dehydrogenase (short-subunit alcohol dehydrogenase family)